MKDQVPVVLLNQWLEISPEKSAFAKKEWCVAGSDEYSVYSSDTMSQALSIKGRSIKNGKINLAKRNSVLITETIQKSNFEKLGGTRHRRMTILNKGNNFGVINKIPQAVIKEVDDLSSSHSSESKSTRQAKNNKIQLPNNEGNLKSYSMTRSINVTTININF